MSETPCADLTDVTLADEDTNSILSDKANRAFQGNVAIQVTPGGQSSNHYKWRHLVAEFVTIAINATWCVTFQNGPNLVLERCFSFPL